MAGEQPAATAELDHQAITVTDRLEEPQDARCDRVCMGPEPQMVDQGKIVAIVRVVSRNHFHILAGFGRLASALLARPGNEPIVAGRKGTRNLLTP